VKVPQVKGLAIHTAPDHGVFGASQTRKRWQGKLVGGALSREITLLQRADLFGIRESNIDWIVNARTNQPLRGLRPQAHQEATRTRIGRSLVHPASGYYRLPGSCGESIGVISQCTDGGSQTDP